MSIANGKKRIRTSNRNKLNSVVLLVLILSLSAMTVAGFKLREAEQEYKAGNESYASLSELVRPGGSPSFLPKTSSIPINNPSAIQPMVEVPYMEIDFNALRNLNPDAAAWLYCPDTAIDYPVMYATDYSYYLKHLPDGTYNKNGSLFIDYHNAPDFSDELTIIYGHHMKTGMMFGSLVEYKQQPYYDEHPYMYIYTDGGNYRIDLIYGCVIGAGEWRERAFMYEENLSELLSYAASNTTFNSQTEYVNGDGVVVLSTCSYEFDSARYVVIGILRHENVG